MTAGWLIVVWVSGYGHTAIAYPQDTNYRLVFTTPGECRRVVDTYPTAIKKGIPSLLSVSRIGCERMTVTVRKKGVR